MNIRTNIMSLEGTLTLTFSASYRLCGFCENLWG